MCPWVALPLDFVQREQRHTVEEALRQLDASLRRAEKYGGSGAASGVAVCVCVCAGYVAVSNRAHAPS